MALALVKLIVPVPVTERLVDVAAFHDVPEPTIVHVPEPIAIVRIPEPLLDTPLTAPVKEAL